MESLLPHKFSRDISEGNSQYANGYIFDYNRSKIYATADREDQPRTLDTLDLSNCVFDALTLIYYARTIDFSKCEIGEKILLNIILDGELFSTYIKYQGREKIKLKGGREFNTIKFSSLLIEGSIFKGGEAMNVWVTDDDNHLPVQIQAEILVGSVNAILLDQSGLSFPLDSEILE